MRYEASELELAFVSLNKNERPLWALAAVFISYVCMLFLMFFAEKYVGGTILHFIVQPFVVGFCTRYVGRLYSIKARAPSVILFAFLYICIGVLASLQALYFIALPIPMLIVFFTSRIKLTRVQEFALLEYQTTSLDIDLHPRSRKTLYAFLGVLFITALTVYWWTSNANSCMNALEGSNNSFVVESCSYNQFSSLEEMATIEDELSIDLFGTFSLPSPEALLIKEKAESGDVFYQRFYFVILAIFYQKSVLWEGNFIVERHREEVAYWSAITAADGFTPAMIKILNGLLDLPLVSEEQKLEAMDLAEELVINGSEEAYLLTLVGKLVTIEDVRQLFHQQSNTLDLLTEEQLENLMYAYKQGDYFYNLSDFDPSIEVEEPYTKSIRVPRQKDKVIDVLKVMSKKFNDTDASYQVAQMLLRESSLESIDFFTLAAEQGHAYAATKLGSLYFCSGRKVESLSWLKRAIKLGSKEAVAIQRKIIKGESLSVCQRGDRKL
ncbi:SEL1-like repeat protein [Shewanella woodyi]|uniref:Sel1 domain protein repeat-containing protein n=1 Tax=Shewanella woodyi (strain ATCC 51908 / MS32) TaxID=392500 RepID=B1KL40_SHEWM|nr:sel1 repeat family protein [Shewanella woodyi]ACA84381.1 hypothetical protein Swoo_0080 [Shewanella woodyi ATCC 51908]